MGYHLKAQGVLPDGTITLLYSLAMLVDAGAALWVGMAYDRLKEKTGKTTSGIQVCALIPFLTLLLPLFILSRSIPLITVGMILFGVILGIHETVMRSAIADLTPYHKRGTGYGVFNTAYGLALLGGASLMGLFYDLGRSGFILSFTLTAELIALLLYQKIHRLIKASP